MADSRTLRAFQPRVGYQPESERPSVWKEEILQIIPANVGWWANFTFQSATTGQQRYTRDPIAAWAAIRRPGGRVAVVPLILDEDGLELTEAKSSLGREFRFIESDFDDKGGPE
jgi:hypothetical protein